MNYCCHSADVCVLFAWLVVPSLQAVAGLPRVSQGGFVSSNLGYYDWFVCTDDGCTEWDGKDIESPKDERSPGNYIQSVATYFGFAIAMAVLSFVCFCCCCLWRMCGCCGGWTPTYVLKRNGKRRSCGCGFHRNLNPLLLGGDKFTYPTTQVLLVRLLMIVFVILTLYVTRCAPALVLQGPRWCGNVLRALAHERVYLVCRRRLQRVHRRRAADGQRGPDRLDEAPRAGPGTYGEHRSQDDHPGPRPRGGHRQ